MISVPIDRIVPLTDARDNFSRLISDIENLSEGLYVLTKGGKPAIALINIKYLEEIMEGRTQNQELRIRNQESESKPTADHKVHEPMSHKPEASSQRPVATLVPTVHHETPKSPEVKFPSFEPPKVSPPLEPSKPVSPPTNNDYDVKPAVNPTWIGEELKINQQSAVSNQQSANIVAPAESREPKAESFVPALPPILQNDKPTPMANPTPKPLINPWPIIPPRREEISSNQDSPIIPPRQSPSDKPAVQQSAVSSQPSANTTPLAESREPRAESTAPEASYPKMVAPPPPMPPSSLPRIPSSFQAVPVPINGAKPVLSTSNSELVGGKNGPVPSTQSPVPTSTQPPVPSAQTASLPPPPITTAPAPFSSSTALPPSPKASEGQSVNQSPTTPPIQFDQPPTTNPEPGDELTGQQSSATPRNASPSAISSQLSAGATPLAESRELKAESPAPAATPPQSQASIQDLEI